MSKSNIIAAVVLYILALMSFLYYTFLKYTKRKYILSLSNAYMLQYVLTLFVITPMAFTPMAWVKLLGGLAYTSAYKYYPYLLKSIIINCFGFIVFMLALIKFEFDGKKTRNLYKLARTSEKYICEGFLNIEFILTVLIWIAYASVYGGFWSSEDTTNLKGIAYYVNMAAQVVISMMTLYYGISYINKKKNLFYFIVGIIIGVLMGKRATLVMDILWGVVVYALYKKVKLSKQVLRKAIKYAVILVLIALAIGSMRSGGSDTNGFTVLQSMIYGNTFSDIRDGGWVLYGFEKNTHSLWVLGRTYLSALLSFVPSSLLSIRSTWDWGKYSTYMLFGWKNHPGFRGGWSMEGYFNFGVLGIILFQILSAKVYAVMEKFFYDEMFQNEKKSLSEKAILPLYIYIVFARRLTCSAGFFAVYVMVLFVLFNLIIGSLYRSRICLR